jgi:hypothetical protein
MLIAAAKRIKRGPQAKAGIIVEEHARLIYDGPRKIDELWQIDENEEVEKRFRIRVGVVVDRKRIMRTRPIFRDWSAEFIVKYIPSQLNAMDVLGFLKTAGEQTGIGDWRPRFGRFAVELA